MREPVSIKYEVKKPAPRLASFVKYFWHLQNYTTENKVVTILPDGYFDILFSSVNKKPFKPFLIGLATRPATYTIPVNSVTFAISFKLPAADHILKTSIAGLLNKSTRLAGDFQRIADFELTGLDNFADIISQKLIVELDKKIDTRKLDLFDKIYASDGSMTVQQLSASVYWESRQINRYFKSRFGISLKNYCNILRFRASFGHLKTGHFYPVNSYFDQAHFIKEVKKFSMISPKYLAENKNDRFIQLSTLPEK